ncbi:MAG: hypothetical protein R3E34_10265 [Rhodocyclaceae bacterium]
MRIQSTAKPKSNWSSTTWWRSCHLPALRRALADDLQHLLHVQPGLLAKGDGLGQALHQAGDGNLVDHLGQLPGAALAQPGEGAGKGHGHRLDARSAAASPPHGGEHAVLRTGLAAGHRRVDELQAQRLGRGRQLARHIGRGRGVVDKDSAALHAGKGAVGARG